MVKTVTNIQVTANDTVAFYNGTDVVMTLSQIMPPSVYIDYGNTSIVIYNQASPSDEKTRFEFPVVYIQQIGANTYPKLNSYALQTEITARVLETYKDLTTEIFKGCCDCGDGGGSLLALPFTTDHISTTGNEYLIGDVVYYSGNVYRCIANNDSILPTNTSYWIDLGAGYPLVQQPADWNATSGNNQILNKPTIPSSSGILHGTASGTDTYTVTITGANTYADGDAYLIRFTNGNTTSATLDINGYGAVDLYRNNDGALIGGDIVDGGEMLCIYNSTTNRFQVIGTAPNTLLGYVTNGESITITKGQAVYAFSGTGDRMVVKLANNAGDATSAQTVGLVLSTSIAANQKGLIMMQGLLDGLSILPDTTWDDGDPVYLGPTAGSVTKTKPYAPNHLVYLGVVTTASNGAAGRMYVKVQNGYELDELHNVQAQTPTVNDVLYFFGGTPGQWKTASISTVLGYIPAGLSSPAFTGTPTAPTAATGTNTTQIATTAFVQTTNLNSAIPQVQMFGDGGDGAVTITAATALNDDKFYSSLTISGLGSINTAGFRVFVNGTLDLTAAGANAIHNPGSDAAATISSAGTPGRVGLGATVSGAGSAQTGVAQGAAGVAGGGTNAAGTNGATPTAFTTSVLGYSSGGLGGAGGAGGTAVGAGGSGGAGQANTNVPSTMYYRGLTLGALDQNNTASMLARHTFTTAGATTFVLTYGGKNGGSGGGGGGYGGGSGSASGSGGGGGGNVFVFAKTVSVGGSTNAAAIAAKGGNGGAGGSNGFSGGSGGGGGGGGGGYIYLVCNSISGSATFITAAGGTGGTGGTTSSGSTASGGTGGQGGGAGRITVVNLSANTITQVDGTSTAGSTATAATTKTGTAGGAGASVTYSS